MSNPFHLSFVVPNLRECERFYVDVLACKKGRDKVTWIDILFYGHQLTLHQAGDTKPPQSIDHFGVILDKAAWLELINSLSKHNIEFKKAPIEMLHDNGSESGKFLILDPASNVLEFKFYVDTK